MRLDVPDEPEVALVALLLRLLRALKAERGEVVGVLVQVVLRGARAPLPRALAGRGALEPRWAS